MKKIIPTAIYLILIPLFSFSNSVFGYESQNEEDYNNLLAAQCNTQEDLSIFVFGALFANTENPYPVELWEHRDNIQINIFDVAREIKSIANLRDKIFSSTNESNHEIILQRLSQMEDIADRALIMEADKWKAEYVNELMKHIIGIRHAGISDLIPNFVSPSNCKGYNPDRDYRKLKNFINPCDENGEHWSSLTELLIRPHNQGPSITNYMKMHGTDIFIVWSWWESQTMDSSWCRKCLNLKAFYSNQRTLNPETYYWGQYESLWLKSHLDETEAKAFIIWHAYVQEVLSKTQFYYNNRTAKQVCLIRTIGLQSLKVNGITEQGVEYTMPNAPYDSFSHTNIFGKNGKDLAIIESQVPHHRIIHLYSLLDSMSFAETEFVVLAGPDLPFDYFYTTNDDISLLQAQLQEGIGVCKGYKLNK